MCRGCSRGGTRGGTCGRRRAIGPIRSNESLAVPHAWGGGDGRDEGGTHAGGFLGCRVVGGGGSDMVVSSSLLARHTAHLAVRGSALVLGVLVILCVPRRLCGSHCGGWTRVSEEAAQGSFGEQDRQRCSGSRRRVQGEGFREENETRGSCGIVNYIVEEWCVFGFGWLNRVSQRETALTGGKFPRELWGQASTSLWDTRSN